MVVINIRETNRREFRVEIDTQVVNPGSVDESRKAVIEQHPELAHWYFAEGYLHSFRPEYILVFEE